MRRSSKAALLFAALGDETRLELISRLCDQGPLSITQIAAGSKVTRQAITKHLHVMEDACLVRNTRRGRESIWHLDQQRLKEARQFLKSISRHWDDALNRLRIFVED